MATDARRRAATETPARIELPRPSRAGGRSVLAALWRRRTTRTIGPRPLGARVLSNLLWSAFGVNRRRGQGPFRGIGRTAGSASNAQELDVYVALAEGLYRYDGPSHALALVAAGDHRPLAISPGQHEMLGDAPVQLVYVTDAARYEAAPFQEPGLRDGETRKSYTNVAVGLAAGNVELFAAATGLASWFHNCDRRGLAEVLELGPTQRAMYGHTVGHPARPAAPPRRRARRGGARMVRPRLGG